MLKVDLCIEVVALIKITTVYWGDLRKWEIKMSQRSVGFELWLFVTKNEAT